MLIAALLLVDRCVSAVSSIEIDTPDRMIKNGPYRFSCNPKCVTWSLIFAAAILLFDSIWLLILSPAVLVYIHLRQYRSTSMKLLA